MTSEVEEAMNLLALKSDFDELVRMRGSGSSLVNALSSKLKNQDAANNNNGSNNSNHQTGGDPQQTQDIPESIPSHIFFETCFNEFFRWRSYRVAAVFTSFVLILWLILLLNRIDVLAQTASYFSQLGALRIMEVDNFNNNVNEMSDLYDHLRLVIKNLDKARNPAFWNFSAATPYPMGMLLIRQLRGSWAYCTAENTMFTGLRQRICSPDAALIDTPFGPDSEPAKYKANGQLPSNDYVSAQDISGIYMGMANSAYTFERHLYFSPPAAWVKKSTSSGGTTTTTTTTTTTSAPASNATTTTTTTTVTPPATTTSSSSSSSSSSSFIVGTAAMLAEIDSLQSDNFLNGSSWSVAIDAAFVHPSPRSFTVITLLMERTPSGDLRPTVQQNTFLVTKLTATDPRAIITFLSDIFIVIFFLYCVAELASDMWAKFDLSKDRVTAFTDSLVPIVITVAQILTLISVLTDRFTIWSIVGAASEKIETTASVEYSSRLTLNALSQISSRLQSSYRNFSVSILLCLARLFVFSESLDGLNMLSRAVRLNGAELVTVLILSAVVVAMFAVAGNVFFDDELMDYSTVASTFSSLSRALSSSGTDAWASLAETSPRQAFFFFMMFWLTLWLVLLNMVLAIVVSAVDAVQRTAQEGRKFDTTWQVLKRHVFLLGSNFSGCRISSDAQHRGGAAVASCAAALTMPLPYSMRYQRWRQEYMTRYSAAGNAKVWALSGEKEVHLAQLNLVLNSIPADARSELYSLASEAYSTDQALQATRSKTVDEVDSVARQLDKQLSILERKLELAPPTSSRDGKNRKKKNRGKGGGDDQDGGGGDGDGDDSDDEVDHEAKSLKRMKSAIRSKGGVAEMLHTTKAQAGFLSHNE